ncbi:hypothetical protein [Thermococcus sp.]|uniref:hypothetical protein n=1 Tax=Thermococcus sp. TaxID=35749 RepID=UPI00199DE366|nr:hypothetical protein [Thermococcus sp.]MBC7094871.1 hypothetical protein [Thermococcus sp.]
MSVYQGVITAFFWLSMDPTVLRGILRDAEKEAILLQPVPSELQVSPGVSIAIGRPNIPLGRIGPVQVSWNPERFSLTFEGPLQKIVEILSRLEESFEKNGYSLRDIVHYYELNLRDKKKTDDFIGAIQGKIKFEDLDLALFSLSLSNRPAPIGEYFYEWLHVTLTPDVNSPRKWVIVQLVKRSKKIEDMVNFVNEIDNFIESVLKSLKR